MQKSARPYARHVICATVSSAMVYSKVTVAVMISRLCVGAAAAAQKSAQNAARSTRVTPLTRCLVAR